jgi:hypothetical protein
MFSKADFNPRAVESTGEGSLTPLGFIADRPSSPFLEFSRLSAASMRDAMLRIEYIDATVDVFIQHFNAVHATLPAGFGQLFESGLKRAVLSELSAREELMPGQTDPDQHLDLRLNCEAFLHSLVNEWRAYSLCNPEFFGKPASGEWFVDMAKFVFGAVDRAFGHSQESHATNSRVA